MAKVTQINGPTKEAKLIGKKFGVNAPSGTGPHPVKPSGGRTVQKLAGHTGPTSRKRKGSGQNDAGNAI